jgi:hypothetical protein
MRCRRPPMLVCVLAVAALSLLATGCGGGGGSSPGVAGISSSTTPTTTASTRQNGLLAFSRCMRSHGVPNFPDPQRFAGGNVKIAIHQLSPSQAALTACSPLLDFSAPDQSAAVTRARTSALLAFARCLRTHGFPSFPDPTSGGELTHAMLATAGIDLHDPVVVHAADTCTSVTHGVITRAIVANFVAGR